MTLPPVSEEVLTRVRRCLCESLPVVEEVDVTSTSCITCDLGAESIELLDIIFRLQNEFRMPISQGDFLVLTSLFPLRPPGPMPEAERRMLLEAQPWRDFDHIAAQQRPLTLSTHYTVGDICRYIEWRLARVYP